jgi:drug/metabolite transporter (DMT)-like permease
VNRYGGVKDRTRRNVVAGTTVTVILALTAAVFIGCSDFLGGLASRTRSALQVTATVQFVGLATLVPIAVVLGADHLTRGDLLLGAASGVATGIAYLGFFAAIGRGRISTVVPITAAITALVPAIVGVLGHHALSSLALVGVLCALVAIPLVAYQTEEDAQDAADTAPDRPADWSTARQVGVAVLCGFGFGAFFVAVGSTSEDAGLWPTVANLLVGGVVTAAIAVVTGVSLALRDAPRLAVYSGLAIGIADAVNTTALQRGPLTVASVLGNLYPIVTIALGAAVLKERVRSWHAVGIAFAIAGVALIAAG